MPKRKDEAHALAKIIRRVSRIPVEEQTEEQKAQAAKSFGRLVVMGDKFIRFWTRKMMRCGMEQSEALSWVRSWLYRIAITFDDANPYFWASAANCMARKRINYIEAQRKQMSREVLVDVANEEDSFVAPCDKHSRLHASMLAKKVNEAVNTVLTPQQKELLAWVVDGGSFKDFAAMKNLRPREVSSQMTLIRNRIKEEIGEETTEGDQGKPSN
jgi:hypothetical protein